MRVTITGQGGDGDDGGNGGKSNKPGLDGKVMASMNAAARSWDDFMATMQIFQSNVQRRNIAGAEAERAKMHAFLDDYVDHYAIAGKLSLGEQT